MTTVHMIGNAHLDPVWLWRRPAGVAEVILTCRTVADLLDEYPGFIFTRSDVWVYEQIEAIDPDLFERIRRFAAGGRWETVGGWYIQPDCNLPTAESFRRHMEIGRDHHRKHFGHEATVGYNVDSFGHAASLPSLLREHGYDSYIFMRPGPHEKTIPANLFRWRSNDGKEVMAWRIHDRYNVDDVSMMEDHICELVARCRVEGVDHVMCFYGVGDHGGGPTRTLIEWIAEHRRSIAGCELVFSSPRRFFDAVRPLVERLPVVQDELQMHAVGCYSVVRDGKVHVRRSEHLAFMAERITHRYPHAAPPNGAVTISRAWRQILFNQFHDIFDGTSVPDAYVDARDEIGAAAHELSSLLHETLFRQLLRAGADELHRLIVYNPSALAFCGYVTHEPWLDWRLFSGALIGPNGDAVAYQVVQQPSRSGPKRMILWKADVPAAGFATYRLRHDLVPAAHVHEDVRVGEGRIENEWWNAELAEGNWPVTLRPSGPAVHPLAPIAIGIHLIDDRSDTWSHGITGYSKTAREHARLERTEVEESGPIRGMIRGDLSCGRGGASIRVLLSSGSPIAEIEVVVTWAEKLTVAKLAFTLAGRVLSRLDGIPGARLERPQDGFEYPVVDSTIVRGEDGRTCAVIGPDAFAIDGTGSTVRYTLLRSPAYAWQGKNGGVTADEHHRWTDRGEHVFRFFVRLDADEGECGAIAEHAHERPIVIDWTTGMSAERGQGAIAAPWAD
jgi:alpha-mannosidase